jgi:hypothetical protein
LKSGSNRYGKLKADEAVRERVRFFYFMAALILQQKSVFSLNDSHAFNRSDHAYAQHWQYDALSRWNLREKASSTSLDLPRLHTAFIFVLCASVADVGKQLSAYI